MHRFEEDPVVPALGAPPGAAGPEYLQHRRPILLCHPRQHGRLLSNRPAKCHRSTNVGIHSLHTQPNPSTRPRVTVNVDSDAFLKSSPWRTRGNVRSPRGSITSVIRFPADYAGMSGLGHQWKFVPGLS